MTRTTALGKGEAPFHHLVLRGSPSFSTNYPFKRVTMWFWTVTWLLYLELSLLNAIKSSYPRRNELEITWSNKELLNSVLLRRSQISAFRDYFSVMLIRTAQLLWLMWKTENKKLLPWFPLSVSNWQSSWKQIVWGGGGFQGFFACVFTYFKMPWNFFCCRRKCCFNLLEYFVVVVLPISHFLSVHQNMLGNS